LFLVECLAKILALGFMVGPHTYLHDAWNYLDLAVVIVGVLDFFPSDGSSNFSALRSMRVMRPLKLVTKYPDLKNVVSVILKCVPDLSNVVGLVVFLLLVFGILGVQLFSGVLRGRCYGIETGKLRETDDPCGFMPCATAHFCMPLGQNPGRGFVAFDNIGSAVLTVVNICSSA